MSWTPSRIWQPDANPGASIVDLRKAGPAGEALASLVPMLGNPVNEFTIKGHSQEKTLDTIVEAYQGQNKHIATKVNFRVENQNTWHFRLMAIQRSGGLMRKTISAINFTPHVPHRRAPFIAVDRITSSSEHKETWMAGYGLGAEMETDRLREPNSGAMYLDMNVAVLAQSIVLRMKLETHLAIMRCKAYYTVNVQINGQPFTSVYQRAAKWAEYIGCLSRQEKVVYKLFSHVRHVMAKNQQAFRMVVFGMGAREQIAYGGNYETEVFRRGPDATDTLELGPDAITTISNVPIFEEDTYVFRGAQGLEHDVMKRTHIFGCYWVSDNGYVSRSFVQNRNDVPTTNNERAIGYVDFDNNAELCTINLEEMITNCVAFDNTKTRIPLNREVLQRVADNYDNQLSAMHMKVPSTPSGDKMLDPFIYFAGRQNAKTATVCRYWGEQDDQYCSDAFFDNMSEINRRRVLDVVSEENILAIKEMLSLMSDAYTVDAGVAGRAGTLTLQAFAQALWEENGYDQNTNEIAVNKFGVPNLPPLISVDGQPVIRFVSLNTPVPGDPQVIFIADATQTRAFDNTAEGAAILAGAALPAGFTPGTGQPPVANIPLTEVNLRSFVRPPGHGMPPGFSTIGHMYYLASLRGSNNIPQGWGQLENFNDNLNIISRGVKAYKIYLQEIGRLFGIVGTASSMHDLDEYQNLYLHPSSAFPGFATGNPAFDSAIALFSNTIDTLKFPLATQVGTNPRDPMTLGERPSARTSPGLYVQPRQLNPLIDNISRETGVAIASLGDVTVAMQLWANQQQAVGTQADLFDDLLRGGSEFARRYEQMVRDGTITESAVVVAGANRGASPWWFLREVTFAAGLYPDVNTLTFDNTNALQKTIAVWRRSEQPVGVIITDKFLKQATPVPASLAPSGQLIYNRQGSIPPRNGPPENEYYNTRISVDPKGFYIGSDEQNIFIYVQPVRPMHPTAQGSVVLAPVDQAGIQARNVPDPAFIRTHLEHLKKFAHEHDSGKYRHLHQAANGQIHQQQLSHTTMGSARMGGASVRRLYGNRSGRKIQTLSRGPQPRTGPVVEDADFGPTAEANDDRSGYGLLNPAILGRVGNSRFYKKRVNKADEYLESDPILRSAMLLYCGTPIYGSRMINWGNQNLVVPLSFVVAAPFVEIDMDAAYFLNPGTGVIEYDYEEVVIGFETAIKLMHIDSTYYLGSYIMDDKTLLVHDGVRFNGYRSGTLTKTWMSNFRASPADRGLTDVSDPDFDIMHPDQRSGALFCLYMGASQTEIELGNGAPQVIDLGGRHDPHGMMRGTYGANGMDAMQYTTYWCALVFNILTAMYSLNTERPWLDETYEQMYTNRFVNTMCFRATQWSYNPESGRCDHRTHSGTGPLRNIRPGIREILDGATGLIEPLGTAGSITVA